MHVAGNQLRKFVKQAYAARCAHPWRKQHSVPGFCPVAVASPSSLRHHVWIRIFAVAPGGAATTQVQQGYGLKRSCWECYTGRSRLVLERTATSADSCLGVYI